MLRNRSLAYLIAFSFALALIACGPATDYQPLDGSLVGATVSQGPEGITLEAPAIIWVQWLYTGQALDGCSQVTEAAASCVQTFATPTARSSIAVFDTSAVVDWSDGSQVYRLTYK